MRKRVFTFFNQLKTRRINLWAEKDQNGTIRSDHHEGERKHWTSASSLTPPVGPRRFGPLSTAALRPISSVFLGRIFPGLISWRAASHMLDTRRRKQDSAPPSRMTGQREIGFRGRPERFCSEGKRGSQLDPLRRVNKHLQMMFRYILVCV